MVKGRTGWELARQDRHVFRMVNTLYSAVNRSEIGNWGDEKIALLTCESAGINTNEIMNTEKAGSAQRKYSQCVITYSSGHYGRVELEKQNKKRVEREK